MQRFSMLCLCLLVLAVGGCVTYQRQNLTPATTALEFHHRTLDDPGLRAFVSAHATTRPTPWPPRPMDLHTLTLIAFYFHPDLEVARAKLAGAQAAIITAGARPNPTLGVGPQFHTIAQGVSPWTLGFTLDVPIETAGKRGFRIAQARILANSARLNVADTAWRVSSRVRGRLLNLGAANQNVGLLTQLQAVQDQIVAVLEDRFKAGQSSLSEVQLVRVAAAQAALQLCNAQRQSDQARVRLADALGVEVGALRHAVFSFDAFDQLPTLQEAEAPRREALLNRPDILGALADYQASQAALQLEVAKQYPDVHLGPGYTFDQNDNVFSLGLSIELPLPNHHQGPIAEAEAHRRQAAAAFKALQARVIGEMGAAFAGYRDARAKLKTADGLLAEQRQRVQSMQTLFDAGAADRLELLQTQMELDAGKLARATVLVETQQALGLLEDALRWTGDDAVRSHRPLPSSNPEPLSKNNLNTQSRQDGIMSRKGGAESYKLFSRGS